MPNSSAFCICAHARDARMMPFDGTQPTLRQSPPMRCFSIKATFAPTPAAIAAVTRPAVPAPITTMLYRPDGCGLTHPAGRTLSRSVLLYSSSGRSITFSSIMPSRFLGGQFAVENRKEGKQPQQRQGEEDVERRDLLQRINGAELPPGISVHKAAGDDSDGGGKNIGAQADPREPGHEVDQKKWK